MNYYPFALSLAREAGARLKASRTKTFVTSHKGSDEKNLITNIDIEISEFILSEIKHAFPEHDRYSEEDTNTDIKRSDYEWTVDPIEGTANFIRNIPHFCVSVALLHNGTPIVGTVFNPITDELFSFEESKGAFFNGAPIHTTGITEPKEVQCLLTIGHQPPFFDWGMATHRSFLESFRKSKNLGSAALDLSFLAAGRADVVVYGTMSTNDCAAGVGMVREAGGEVYTPQGIPVELSWQPQTIIATANRELFDKILPLTHPELLPH